VGGINYYRTDYLLLGGIKINKIKNPKEKITWKK